MDILKEELKAILAQKNEGKKIHLMIFIFYKNNKYKRNYLIINLEKLAVF